MPSGLTTHPSVRSLVGTSADPVAEITAKARAMVFRAMESGWTGPPFDPVSLADMLRIGLTPCDDVPDARTVPTPDGQFLIEFNPWRPPARVRYSIAHEIAHTLFPDCAERVRNRSAHNNSEDWPLEMLCNIAAAEILMPIGSLEAISQQALSISLLKDLQKRYEVSMEALLLRLVRLSSEPLAVFCGSRNEADHYVLDYAVTSRSFCLRPQPGTRLPEIVSDCTAVGFTAVDDVDWTEFGGQVHIECMGIPPYPGHKYPRVVGVWRPSKPEYQPLPEPRYVKGDARHPHGRDEKLLVHIVNDKTPRWGAGFAKELKRQWPEVQREFIEWVGQNSANFHLGEIHAIKVAPKLTVVHMIAQRGYGPSGRPGIRYGALESCLEKVSGLARDRVASVHMPRIGCGEARGDWRVVSELIQDLLCSRGVDVTVYDLHDGKQENQKAVQEYLPFG